MSTILVVDDETMVRATLRHCLEQAGHAVSEAGSGLVAFDLLRQQPFDLVLIDIFMPYADGVETILGIRREGYRVPIIAMSGGGDRMNMDFLRMVKNLGADETLQKPFRHIELLSLVERFAQCPALRWTNGAS